MNELEKYFSGQVNIGSYSLKSKLFKYGFKEKMCERCKLTNWLEFPIPLELHHINGNSKDNSLGNLQILCSNCHSLTDNFRAQNSTRKVIKKSIPEIINAIENSYNPRSCLLILGYAAKGANYSRIYAIMEKYGVKFRAMTEEEKAMAKQRSVDALAIHWNMRRSEAAKDGRVIIRKSKSKQTQQEAWMSLRRADRPNKDELLRMVWERSVSLIAKSFNVSDNAIRKWAKSYVIPVPPVGYWAKFHNGHFDECSKIKNDLFTAFKIGPPDTI